MKKRVLIISNLEIFFIEDDVEIISEFADTTLWNTAEKGLFNHQLVNEINRCDIIYCWFASIHSFLPALLAKLTNKKLIIVSGGYDTANISDINYGHAGHPVKKIISKTILSLADRIIVNSNHSKDDVLSFIPHVEPKLRVILHRIAYREPHQLPERDEKLIITVIRLHSMNYIRKKVSLIKKVAEKMPDYTFVHIGHILEDAENLFYKNLPDNFQSIGFVPDDTLWNWYHKAGYLIAPSWHEGFGLTAVEALAGGCIPVISGSGAQQEVTLGLAHLIQSDDPETWAAELKSLEIDSEERERRKQVVQQTYHKRKRPRKLLETFSEICPDLVPETENDFYHV